VFNVLNVRSGDDLTTRARIRDAAITRFARDGFRVPLRVIAADAGVSPALVIHHFGSKDGLRTACDEHVLEHSFLLKSGVVANADPAFARQLFGNLEQFDEPIAYVLQSMLEGGGVARSILGRAAAAAEEYLESGVAAGVVRPSRDPAGRARYLTYASLGVLVTAFLAAPRDESDPYANVTRLLGELALPHLEVMTHGLLAGDELLRTADEWVAQTAPPDHPATRREP
jgi:AcrR family transcriptional regulator